jgi:preprotein translocase subunit SecE
MAKEAVVQEGKPPLFQRVTGFLQDVRIEMKKVTWPSRDELKMHTSVVLILLGIMAAVIYVYDLVFQVVVVGLFKLV